MSSDLGRAHNTAELILADNPATAGMDETGLAEDWNEYEHRGQQAIQLLRDTAAGVGGGNIPV